MTPRVEGLAIGSTTSEWVEFMRPASDMGERASTKARRRRPLFLRTLARTVAAWLGLASLGAAALGCAADSRPRATAASSSPRAIPLSRERIDALVTDLARETAQIRGLTFQRRVPVTVETTAQIAEHWRDTLRDERDEIETEEALGIGLGVIAESTHLADALTELVGREAQGYYDPDSGDLVLVDTEAASLGAAGPAGLDARATVVHELTHALQHQHHANMVTASSSRQPALSDGARARLALLEGDATIVAMEWAQHRRGTRFIGAPDMLDRVRRWVANAQVLTEANAPAYLIDSAEAPYEAGALAVAQLVAAGGFSRVDSMLTAGVTRTAEVLHPEREAAAWVDLSTPSASAASEAPAADASPATRVASPVSRSLGEMELRLFLQRVIREERAAELAASWRGDWIVLERLGPALRVRWRVACANAAEAARLAQTLQPLVERWQRDGCPRMVGGSRTFCPATIDSDGALLRVSRGQ